MSPYRRRVAQAVVASPFLALPVPEGVAISQDRGLPLSAAQVARIESNPVIDFVVQPDLRPLAFLSRGRQDGLAAALLQHASEWLGLSFRPVAFPSARMACLQRAWLGETVAAAGGSPWVKGAATGIGLALTAAAALAFHRRMKPGPPPG